LDYFLGYSVDIIPALLFAYPGRNKLNSKIYEHVTIRQGVFLYAKYCTVSAVCDAIISL